MLIDDFCPTEEAIDQLEFKGVFNNGKSIKNQFNHNVFAFEKAGNSKVPEERLYIFCKVSVCINGLQECDLTNYCSQSGATRKKRDTKGFQSTNVDGETIIKIGPIYPDEFKQNGHKVIHINDQYTRVVRDALISNEINSVLRENANERIRRMNEIYAAENKKYMATWIILLVAGVVGILLVLMFSYHKFSKKMREAERLTPAVSSVSLAK